MTTKDPRNLVQEKVNRGRRRKMYQTREDNKRDDPERDRTTKTTESSFERRSEKIRERKIRRPQRKSLRNKGKQFKWPRGASKNTRNVSRNGHENREKPSLS